MCASPPGSLHPAPSHPLRSGPAFPVPSPRCVRPVIDTPSSASSLEPQRRRAFILSARLKLHLQPALKPASATATAMSKYSALPDIDYNAPDVYETPDTPSDANALIEDSLVSTEETSTDEIVRLSTSTTAAREKFQSSVVDASNVDFSGKLSNRKRPLMYKTINLPDREVYSIIPSSKKVGRGFADEQESPFDKLRRLLAETEELQEEIEAIGSQASSEPAEAPNEDKANSSPLSHSELVQQLAALQAELGKISSHAHSAAGEPNASITKHLETGKSLMAQLKAFKELSLGQPSDSSAAPAAEAQADAEGAPSASPASAAATAAPAAGSVTYELYYSPETAKLTQLTKVTELEGRLTSLERLFGSNFLQQSGEGSAHSFLRNNGSLVAALDNLDHHLTLLANPRHLDQISKRVKVLTMEMANLSDLHKQQQIQESATAEILEENEDGVVAPLRSTPSETDKKILYLHSTMERLEPMSNIIPQLITRLHSLKTLHQEAAVFSESLKMLTQGQDKLEDNSKLMQSAIARLESSIADNQASVENNIEALEKRMSGLIERIEKL
ncbi:Dynamitin-domain-containing protein [Polychytrium aggregatum]|uniref:Dynamitin-domain-containing protein n=1 Tax=Polychytrium aggregatum TaxID=110093 RepID=UPI0022FDC548|nr:Dynamitin-domain-containing protein [Polychytrium aggregatum]KAI9193190.1 Dynamitin-domain-containing protein [Polychytrium aggregatum]